MSTVNETERRDSEEDEIEMTGMPAGKYGNAERLPMEAQEVPVHEWPEFFEKLTKRHLGEVLSIEVDTSNTGMSGDVEDTEIVARDLPLMGISPDLDDGEAGSIQIMVGDTSAVHLTHTVTEPTYVWFYQTDAGEDAALEIESADSPTTIIHF